MRSELLTIQCFWFRCAARSRKAYYSGGGKGLPHSVGGEEENRGIQATSTPGHDFVQERLVEYALLKPGSSILISVSGSAESDPDILSDVQMLCGSRQLT